MVYKYPNITDYCKNCLGCARLEDPNFKGIIRCEYHTDIKNDISFKRNTPIK